MERWAVKLLSNFFFFFSPPVRLPVFIRMRCKYKKEFWESEEVGGHFFLVIVKSGTFKGTNSF